MLVANIHLPDAGRKEFPPRHILEELSDILSAVWVVFPGLIFCLKAILMHNFQLVMFSRSVLARQYPGVAGPSGAACLKHSRRGGP